MGLSELPRVDSLLADPSVEELAWTRELKRLAVGEVLTRERRRVSAGEPNREDAAIVREVVGLLATWTRPAPRAVINATGVLLHTNLGRARLSDRAIRAMSEAAGACDLEFDLASGARGNRMAPLDSLLRATTGAQASHVVNNGAAALLLACTALGAGGSVAVSRGQMVEIGDSFRVADMAAAGGVALREVGATNKTHLRDYEAAVEAGSRVLLWVHRSNFTQAGFVAEPSLRELGALAKRLDVALVADLGSGCLGGEELGGEPTIAEILGQGAQLVTCSGDKLLGGPQSGLLCGSLDRVQRCRRHPMARALRVGKTGLAALHATLVAHARSGPTALPLHQGLRASIEELESRAAMLLAGLTAAGLGDGCFVRRAAATVGGGALPGSELPSVALALGGGETIAQRLRDSEPPVVGRLRDGEVLLDLRGVDPVEDATLLRVLRSALTTEADASRSASEK